jgi:hypothetical protein
MVDDPQAAAPSGSVAITSSRMNLRNVSRFMALFLEQTPDQSALAWFRAFAAPDSRIFVERSQQLM